MFVAEMARGAWASDGVDESDMEMWCSCCRDLERKHGGVGVSLWADW